jgi:signal transduction histidine kinase
MRYRFRRLFEYVHATGGMPLVYLSFVLCFIGILAIALRGAALDFSESRNRFQQSEINRLRSHAFRTSLRFQEYLQNSTLETFNPDLWLRGHWVHFVDKDDSNLYAAVVDSNGRILFHSNPKLEGKQLPAVWYDRVVTEAGDDVFDTHAPELTGGARILDISVPLVQNNHQIATYHNALNYAWFEQELKHELASTQKRWLMTTLLILVVVILACGSAIYVTRRIEKLRRTIELGHVRRLAELGQLAGGIAHEIRNPMNAIRLNLHVIERLWHDHTATHNEDEAIIVEQTLEEMERIDSLVRSLLDYTRPEQANAECIDMTTEVRGALAFLRPLLNRDDISIDAELSADPLWVLIDRRRLRQIVFNLISNGTEATGLHGQITLRLIRNHAKVEMIIADSGPGVPEQLRERIFEPFFSTKDLGTGLGLALVKRFVEEADGEIVCEASTTGGAQFRISLPLIFKTELFETSPSSNEAHVRAAPITDSVGKEYVG